MDSTSPGSAPAVRKHVRHVGHTCTLGQYWPEKETTSWPNSGEIRSNCWKHVIDIVVVDVGGGRAGGSEGCDGGRFAAVLSPRARHTPRYPGYCTIYLGAALPHVLCRQLYTTEARPASPASTEDKHRTGKLVLRFVGGLIQSALCGSATPFGRGRRIRCLRGRCEGGRVGHILQAIWTTPGLGENAGEGTETIWSVQRLMLQLRCFAF